MSLTRRSLLRLGTACAATTLLFRAATSAFARSRPNIVFIVADDLGYGELGCFGQKRIRTPCLDRMASQGMRLTCHYSGNAVCAPSRCVLMTGLHPGHAFIRDNREVQPEGQLPLPDATLSLARLLKQAGYVTGAMGKWGLGGPRSAGEPLRQGFDHFFGYNCQRHAHNYYPNYLWHDDRRVPLDNPPFSPQQKLPAGADPKDPASYRDYAGRQYAPDLIWERARGFISDNRERPFFLFLPTTVPHLALQVPEDSLAEYEQAWDDTPYDGGKGYLPHRRPRAAYAAMVTRMDREIGRILALLADLNLEQDTLVVFTSDNGPTYDGLGGSDSDFFNSAAGLRGRKGSLYEGGVRVPLIARWPGRIAPGSTSDHVTGFEDWLPTLLELAGASEHTPRGLDGISFASTLLGQPQAERPFLYREFPAYGGQQSIRAGRWKAIRQNLRPQGKAPPSLSVELYDLENDPTETTDVAANHADRLGEMRQLMTAQHRPSPEFPFPALDRA